MPYPVGLIFDEIYMSDFEILGCAETDLKEEVLIGRDLLNLLKIELNGPASVFTIKPDESEEYILRFEEDV